MGYDGQDTKEISKPIEFCSIFSVGEYCCRLFLSTSTSIISIDSGFSFIKTFFTFYLIAIIEDSFEKE